MKEARILTNEATLLAAVVGHCTISIGWLLCLYFDFYKLLADKKQIFSTARVVQKLLLVIVGRLYRVCPASCRSTIVKNVGNS